MKIEIWSDVVCPWCYIGKRRFETALSQFENKAEVTIQWRSFQLDPTAPATSGESVNQMLAHKYGMTLEQAIQKNREVSELAAKEGLEYHLDQAQRGNTFDAHRLIHLAARHNLQDAMKERLMKAYFTEGKAIGDLDTLVSLGSEVGLDTQQVRQTIESQAFAAEVKADEKRGSDLGIRGVPFFVFDEKFGVSGAQPAEVFLKVLDKAWQAAQYPA